MDWAELIDIIKGGEDTRLEFKESQFLKDTDDIAKQLVSFANRYGGQILIGVRDNGTVEGARIEGNKKVFRHSKIGFL